MSSSSTPQPRTLSRELKHNIDQVVTIKGWLHKKRLLGGLTFINVRDRSGLTQVLIENKDEVEKLRGMQIGTVLEVQGTVKAEPRAPSGAVLVQEGRFRSTWHRVEVQGVAARGHRHHRLVGENFLGRDDGGFPGRVPERRQTA
jgi:aspartyl-tRNA synthetase